MRKDIFCCPYKMEKNKLLYAPVPYTENLYLIQSNRVENASNAPMSLQTTLVNFGYSSSLIDNVCILHWHWVRLSACFSWMPTHGGQHIYLAPSQHPDHVPHCVPHKVPHTVCHTKCHTLCATQSATFALVPPRSSSWPPPDSPSSLTATLKWTVWSEVVHCFFLLCSMAIVQLPVF